MTTTVAARPARIEVAMGQVPLSFRSSPAPSKRLADWLARGFCLTRRAAVERYSLLHGRAAAMNWYTAVLVLECIIEGKAQHSPELQIRLVEARNHDDAYTLALELGAQAEHSYQNDAGEEISWRFRGLSDLNEILSGSPRHGAEVYSLRSEQSATQVIRPRHQLTVFWREANKHKTAREIIEGK
jgi:hypothetical protein